MVGHSICCNDSSEQCTRRWSPVKKFNVSKLLSGPVTIELTHEIAGCASGQTTALLKYNSAGIYGNYLIKIKSMINPVSSFEQIFLEG